MAFAQPYIPASKGALQNEQVYFYLDNSYSMNRSSGDQITAFEEGIEYIRELIEVYPQGTNFYLLTNDFAPFSHAPHSGRQLQELLTELKFSGVIRSANEIFSRWQSMKAMSGEGDYYFISDFQKSTKGMPDVSTDIANARLLPVFPETTANIYIDTAYLDNPFLIGKERVRLHVDLKNISDKLADDVTVRIFLDDVQIASTTTDLSSFETKTLGFDLVTASNRQSIGRISIEEYPVTFDNDVFFVLDLGEKITVTEIHEEQSATPISKVFGNKNLFNFKSFNYNNLDYNSIQGNDLLLLNGISNFSTSFLLAVNEFLQNGGQVVIIPNENPDIESYKNLFGAITLTDTIQQQKILTPDFTNPFFNQVFEERDPAIDMPAASPIITWSLPTPPLLKLSNGMPFLSIVNEQIFLFAAPFKDLYTTIHKHALFVPVMYKIAALSTDNERPLYHYLDQRLLVYSFDSLSPSQIFKLKQQDKEIIPAQRVNNQRLILQLPAYQVDAGFYQLVAEQQNMQTIAFNINKEESKLESYTFDELKEITNNYTNMTIYEVENVDEFRSRLTKEFVGWSLWKYCLILSIIFLLAEILIIRFVP